MLILIDFSKQSYAFCVLRESLQSKVFSQNLIGFGRLLDWLTGTYFKLGIKRLTQYFVTLCVGFHETNSLFGFFILLVVSSQLISGTMLSFSLIPDSALVPIVRDEEDIEDLFVEDFFWVHERGVDLIFIFSYMHLFRKLYIGAYDLDQEVSWKSGVFTFLVFQAVTFFGLVLCCTHLSEITLTIAANILHTFSLFYGKIYWWIFTDKTLNTDTLVRLAYAHYLSAFYMFYLALLHGLDLHYDWKNEVSYDGVETELAWWDEAFSNELGTFLEMCLLLVLVCLWLYPEPESLSYELFMWGDIGLVTDVRFYGVAPHWYFRPFMAWLIVCPNHNTGIFGLLLFFFALFHQPTLHGIRQNTDKKWLKPVNAEVTKLYFSNIEVNLITQLIYVTFVMAALYTATFLPYGRFYNRVGGNFVMPIAYVYMLAYLIFYWIRKPSFAELDVNRFIFKLSRFGGCK